MVKTTPFFQTNRVFKHLEHTLIRLHDIKRTWSDQILETLDIEFVNTPIAWNGEWVNHKDDAIDVLVILLELGIFAGVEGFTCRIINVCELRYPCPGRLN